MNTSGEEWGLIKKREDRVSGDDVREGLTAIVSVKLAEPQFEGQTKTKLGNTEVKGFVQRVGQRPARRLARREPGRGQGHRAQGDVRARRGSRPARPASARARARACSAAAAFPASSRDCQSTNPEECEIFVVEGDSAGGSAKGGRDPHIQAILPIRGKILNVEKARIDKVLANNEVQAIISALGTGIHQEFDIEKVPLPQDRDDGRRRRRRSPHPHAAAHAAVPLHEAAHRARLRLPRQPPLYRLRWNKPHEHDFVYSDAERDAVMRAASRPARSCRRRTRSSATRVSAR